MALGWRCLTFVGIALTYKTVFQQLNGQTYGPLLSAFFRKYHHLAQSDPFQITDRKREFYEIDTSQYMNYDFEDLGDEYHINHGPQPEGEAMDSSWLAEMDKFLKGEDNKFKEHKNFVNYQYEYIDKSFPTIDKARNLMQTPVEATPKNLF